MAATLGRMNGWWVSETWAVSPVLTVSWAVWVVMSITLHELGHGYAATWQGDRTPRDLGRLTPNPLVHMGGASLIAFAIFGFAWGMMPVDPRQFRWRGWGEALVAFAGPAVNIVLGLIALTIAGVMLARVDDPSPSQINTLTFLLIGGSLNGMLLVLNMIPVPPLDGATVVAEVVPGMRAILKNPQVQTYGALAVLVLFATGLFGWLWGPVEELCGGYAGWVARITAG